MNMIDMQYLCLAQSFQKVEQIFSYKDFLHKKTDLEIIM